MRTIDLEFAEDLPHRRGRGRRRPRGHETQSRPIQCDDAHPPAGAASRHAVVPPRGALHTSLDGGTHPARLCGPSVAPGGRGGQPNAHRQAQRCLSAGLAREHGRQPSGSHPVALSHALPRCGGGARNRNGRGAGDARDELRARGRLRVRALHCTWPRGTAGVRGAAGARDIQGDTPRCLARQISDARRSLRSRRAAPIASASRNGWGARM